MQEQRHCLYDQVNSADRNYYGYRIYTPEKNIYKKKITEMILHAAPPNFYTKIILSLLKGTNSG